MALGNFGRLYEPFFLNDITKSNDLTRHLLSIIDSLLVEKIVLPNHTADILENILKIVRSYPVLWYMF